MFKRGLFGISMLTMACLYGMLTAIVFLACIIAGVELSVVILISIFIFLLQFLLAPFFTDICMKWFYKANFNYEIPEYLKNFIATTCAEHKMKYPKIGVIDDGAPNAFTYGRTKNDARVVFTRGILELLTEEEVKAVVAHELGHAVHYDMLFMTVAQLVPLILYYVYEVLAKNVDDDDSSKLAIVGLIAYLFYVISQYVILWLSRVREYYADSFAVEETKNPNALAEALVKIGYGLTTKANKSAKLSASRSNTLGIFDAKTSKSLIVSSYDDGGISKENIKKAMRWEKWNVWAKWYEFFSTHPLISKRLEAITERCNEFGQSPYIVFDEEKPESYVDDFIFEAILIMSPTILTIVGVILVVIYLMSTNVIYLKTVIFVPAIILLVELFKHNRIYKRGKFKDCKIVDLLSEVKVSGVTTVPCVLEGEVIGKGDPGSIFDEDYVLKDDSGIVFVDSRRILKIMDLFAGLFKTKTMFGKKVKIKGWYRRSPIPFVEVYELEVEGEAKKKFYSTIIKRVVLSICLCISIVLPLLFIFM